MSNKPLLRFRRTLPSGRSVRSIQQRRTHRYADQAQAEKPLLLGLKPSGHSQSTHKYMLCLFRASSSEKARTPASPCFELHISDAPARCGSFGSPSPCGSHCAQLGSSPSASPSTVRATAKRRSCCYARSQHHCARNAGVMTRSDTCRWRSLSACMFGEVSYKSEAPGATRRAVGHRDVR